MNNQILTDGTSVYYVVRVNGKEVTQKVATQLLAEMEKQKLSPEMQAIAEVVPVTASGADLLLG